MVKQKQAAYLALDRKIKDFNKIRGWNPVPEDIAKAISIEAAELLEHFQWDASDHAKYRKVKNWQEIALEVADVFWYLVTFCQKTKIDLSQAVEDKIKILEKKYPRTDFNGEFNPKAYYESKEKYRQKTK